MTLGNIDRDSPDGQCVREGCTREEWRKTFLCKRHERAQRRRARREARRRALGVDGDCRCQVCTM